VRPGDTLSGRYTVIECIPSRSKPDRGIVRSVVELRNQHDEVVLTCKGMGLFWGDDLLDQSKGLDILGVRGSDQAVEAARQNTLPRTPVGYDIRHLVRNLAD
jgi:hypothetical protein